MSTSTAKSSKSARVECANNRCAQRLRIVGQVQGVGFRPFVYRLATELALSGCVANCAQGVEIRIEGPLNRLHTFAERLCRELPPAARIDAVRTETVPPVGARGFYIKESEANGAMKARAPRDIRVCSVCAEDVARSTNRRFAYPFTSCTDCGPRYSAIESLPYDRVRTSFRHFPLCGHCTSEYTSPVDRRFHAQAIVCSECGPQVQYRDANCAVIAERDEAIACARRDLIHGKIVALKGLGGYQLLVRADDSAAVSRLRQRKLRPTRPLAVMTQDISTAEAVARLSLAERNLLASPENPIVLVYRNNSGSQLAESVSPGLRTVGLFLPTTPLHQLLIQRLGFPLVATSGNQSNEPPAIDESDAHQRLNQIADAFLDHNRPIVRRVDDSVARIIDGKPVVLRLGRGYAPMPLPGLENTGSRPILATGGHLKAALAFFNGSQAVLAQHIGDLDSPIARTEFDAVAFDLQRVFQFQPVALATDLHPDYFSTRWAEQQKLPMIGVQHHHAHAAAVQAEHSLLDQECLALTWDGTGFGDDGTLWGGECLITKPNGGFRRVASLRLIPLIGGEAAIREPARIALAMLSELFGVEDVLRHRHLLRRLGLTPEKSHVLLQMLRRRSQVVWSSAIGRLFDGIAALVLGRTTVSYEGEAAIALESIAENASDFPYSGITLGADNQGSIGDQSIPRGDWRPMLAEILHDIEHDVEPGIIAGRFHATVSQWATNLARKHTSRPVVLGGGCFQNRLLSEQIMASLRQIGASVLTASMIPPSDGGLAAGQLAVAMQRMRKGDIVPCA
jgi:hydrogenase maturation protein HypF